MYSKLPTVRSLLGATALCASLAAMPAHAANAATDDGASEAAPAPAAAPVADQQTDTGALAEITVTAERRTGNLVKTPVSVSVVSSQDLENRHIYSLTDLNDGSAPGLTVQPYASRPFNMILAIRGVGIMQDTNQPAQESGVGVYIDGVYLGRPQGLDAGMYDLESVEVLKGPQGTLFGRNTEAGALNITTKKPTGKFGMEMLGGVGNYGSYESQFHLNLPSWHDIAIKVDGMIQAHDGWVKNPMPGQSDWNAVNRRGVRVQARWTPAPNFTADYAFDISHTEDTTTFGYTVKAASGPGTTPIAAASFVTDHRIDVAPIGVPMQPSIGNQLGHTLTLKWDAAPWLTVKSISAYRQLDQSQYQAPGTEGITAPTSASALEFERYSLASFTQYQLSQELQFLGESGRWKYVGGVMFFHEHTNDQAQAFYDMQWDAVGAGTYAYPITYTATGNNSPAGVSINNLYGQPGQTGLVHGLYPNIGIDRASWNSTDSLGFYGQTTYTPPILHDIVHLTGGLRWNSDRKHGELYDVNNALPLQGDGVTRAPIDFTHVWRRVDPMVNLSIDVFKDAMIYGKWGTGYRAGGANSRSITYGAFNPESISMFEVGFKGEFLNHHARFTIDGYTGTYKDVFYDISAPYYSYNPDGTINTKTTRTTEDNFNMKDNGKVSGIETEFMLAPVRGLTLTGSYTYAYVRMPNQVVPYPTYNVNGQGQLVATYPAPTPYNQLYTPRHRVTGALDYTGRVSAYTLRFHFDGNWNDGSYSSGSNVSYTNTSGQTVYVGQLKSQPGAIFNTRVSIGDIELAGSGAKVNLSFWVRNLFNATLLQQRSGSYLLPSDAAAPNSKTVSGSFNDPRTFGGTVSVKF